MAISARCFEVVQYEFAPDTNEDLHFNENNILSALEHKSIKQWAYIRHDKDNYTEEEDIKSGGIHKVGTPRNAHWHCVCKCDKAIELDVVAKWFGVPVNQVQVGKGRGAFEDKVQYLTHEAEKQQLKGKHRYDDSEVHANFEWRAMLDELEADRLKYGEKLSTRDRFRYDVLYNGMTLKQCEAADRLNYMNDLDKLKKLRLEYISNQRPPLSRINYYVSGKGGVGKGLICRAIARSLFPQYEDDEDIFFNIGASGVAFDGYDGQPVLIWNDCRAFELLKILGGRGNVFNVFDTHPTKQRQSVKFGSVNLCNVVNIVNSVDSYTDFLDGLAGEYTTKDGVKHEAEDKGQAYRRFPMIIPLHEEDFDLYLNKGFINNTADFEEYIQYCGIMGNMQKIAVQCGNNEALAKELQSKAVKPITDKHQEVLEVANRDVDEDAVRKQFEHVGEQGFSHEGMCSEQLPGQLKIEDYFTSKDS